jgi:hypothetical protein
MLRTRQSMVHNTSKLQDDTGMLIACDNQEVLFQPQHVLMHTTRHGAIVTGITIFVTANIHPYWL